MILVNKALALSIWPTPAVRYFEAAAKAGFKAVEFLFPYEHPAAEIAARLADYVDALEPLRTSGASATT